MNSATDKKIVRPEPFDLIGFALYVLKKWYILLACALVCSLALSLYAVNTTVPKYVSKAMIFVAKTGTIDSLQELQNSSYMADDYIVIAKSYPVLDTVISELYLQDGVSLTRKQASEAISVKELDNTHIIQFVVTYDDPQIACDLCNILTDTMTEQIAYIMSTDKPTLVQRAEVSSYPSNGVNLVKEVFKGTVAGLAVAIAALYIAFVLNDKVKTPEDVEKYIGVPVLISIPLDKAAVYKDKRKKKA